MFTHKYFFLRNFYKSKWKDSQWRWFIEVSVGGPKKERHLPYFFVVAINTQYLKAAKFSDASHARNWATRENFTPTLKSVWLLVALLIDIRHFLNCPPKSTMVEIINIRIYFPKETNIWDPLPYITKPTRCLGKAISPRSTWLFIQILQRDINKFNSKQIILMNFILAFCQWKLPNNENNQEIGSLQKS